MQADVSECDESAAMVDATVEEFDGVDVRVDNTGVVITDPAEEFDIKEWRRVIDVDLTGTFICSQLAAREMIDGDGGAIVNVVRRVALPSRTHLN